MIRGRPLRSRIGTRIEGIRNRAHSNEPSRSHSDGFSSTSLPTQTFSELQRMQSADGFLVVGEDDVPFIPDPSSEQERTVGGAWVVEAKEEEDEEDGMSHLALDQQGAIEDTSDVDIDDLVADLDDEEPRPKPEEGGMAKVKPQVAAGKKAEIKPWMQGNKEVYEQQLELIQEHLMTAMLENQTLQGGCGCVCG